jgi:ribosome-associated protein
MKISEKIKNREFDNEFRFLTSKSSGPGGQHVNKTNSKVQLVFSIQESMLLDDSEKSIMLQKLASKIDTEGKLQLQSQESRSQRQNKEEVVKKFYDLLSKVFEKKKVRHITRPSKGAIEKRLKEKKMRAGKKESRNFKSE